MYMYIYNICIFILNTLLRHFESFRLLKRFSLQCSRYRINRCVNKSLRYAIFSLSLSHENNFCINIYMKIENDKN